MQTATDLEFYQDKIRFKACEYGSHSPWAGAGKFLKELRSTFVTETGLIPPGLRWISPSKTFWLFESAPKLQQVIFHHGEADEGHEGKKLYSYAVQLPWTAMLVEINLEFFPIRTWVFALEGPLRDLKDKVGLLPLPNHYPCAQVCYPKDANLKANTVHNVGDAIRLAQEFAWYSYANEDITDTFDKTMEMKMPAYLFVDDKENWRGDFKDMTDLLAAWSKTSTQRILTCETPYLAPSNSILAPEQLMGGDPMPTLNDVLLSSCQVEQYNYAHNTYFEEAVRAAHSRSL